MNPRFLMFGVAIVLAACGMQKSDVVGLQDISGNLEEWDGKVVTVEGWLLQCDGLNCHLVPTHSDLELMRTGCPGERCDLAITRFEERAVSIGYDETFDRAAKPLEGEHVLVTARVNASAWLSPGLDRSGALQPISIIAYDN